jgi:type II secretory pathway component HofQ
MYLRGAASIGLGKMIKYLRRSTGGAAGNGLCTVINPTYIKAGHEFKLTPL